MRQETLPQRRGIGRLWSERIGFATFGLLESGRPCPVDFTLNTTRKPMPVIPAKKAAAKKAAPAKSAAQATITLKHLAAALADSHDIAKKQAEAVLGDLVTLTTRHLKKGDKIRSDRPRHPPGAEAGGQDGTQSRRPARPSRSRPVRRSHSGLPGN